MILQIKTINQLMFFHKKLFDMMGQFIDKTHSPYNKEQIFDAIYKNLNNSILLFVALNDYYEPIAYSIVQVGFDPTFLPVAYVWQYYSENGNGKEIAKNGLPMIEQMLKEMGIKKLQMVTKRNVEAFKKVLLDEKWTYGGTIMEKEVN